MKTLFLLLVSFAAIGQIKSTSTISPLSSTIVISSTTESKEILPDGTKAYPMTAVSYQFGGGYNVGEREKEISESKPFKFYLPDGNFITLIQIASINEIFQYKAGFTFYKKDGDKVTLLSKEQTNGFGASWKCLYDRGYAKSNGYINELTIDLELDKIIYIPFTGRYYKCIDCKTEQRTHYIK